MIQTENGNGKDCELSDGNVTEMGISHNNGNGNVRHGN